MRLSKPSAAMIAMLFAIPAQAATRQDEQIWINLTAIGSIDSHLAYFVEVQPRIGEGASRLSQLLLRPAIGWKIAPTLTVYQGYAHIVLPIQGGRDRNEERSFQQIGWTIGPVGHGDLQSRTRLEQRWLSNGRDMGWRLREMIRLKLPLTARKRGVGALGWAEGIVALNDTDWGARKGFDQIRLFAGVEIPLPGKSTVELGYMNQTIDQAAGTHRMNHIASMTLWFRP